MTTLSNITKLLQQGTHESFEYLYKSYADCLLIKSNKFVNNKNKQDLIKLDEWLHNTLPSLIQERKPDPYITHDELINIIKWKLLRTCVKNNNKNLKNLIIMNSPRLVMNETKKAFKVLLKKNNIQMALSYLTNLKGITLTTATLIMSLLKPTYPYMSDECIESIPEIYSLNYNINNYISLINYFNNIMQRLDGWNFKTIEHIIWIYQILLQNKSYDLLLNIPEGGGNNISNDTNKVDKIPIVEGDGDGEDEIEDSNSNSNLSTFPPITEDSSEIDEYNTECNIGENLTQQIINSDIINESSNSEQNDEKNSIIKIQHEEEEEEFLQNNEEEEKEEEKKTDKNLKRICEDTKNETEMKKKIKMKNF